MRLSALAEAVLAEKIEAIFIGEITELPWVTKRLDEMGFSKILASDEDFVPNSETDILILDSYSIPIENNFIQPRKWLHVVAISDSLTPLYQTSLTVYPEIETKDRNGLKRKILSGPKYILLRKGIRGKVNSSKLNDKIKIVVTGGGSDPFDFSGEMSRILADIDLDFQVTFLVSRVSNCKADSRFIFVDIGPSLDEIIDEADIVFTTASTTCLEMIAREIPVGVVCAVENQLETYESLSRLGIVQVIGFKDSEWKIDIKSVKDLIDSPSIRSQLITRNTGIIDQMGSARVLKAILDLPKQID
jgi:spore coat polysaccharide biosynthesis predicted glycosyltransferase SpsG